MKQLIRFFFGFIIFLICAFPALAASFTLQGSPSSLYTSDEYTISATLPIGSSNGANYFLRGAFYQDGTNNYCRYTYNGSDWYNGPYTMNNGWENLLPITIENSSWSGQLKAKLDLSDNGCKNSGTYHLKIERFTVSGNGTFDNQNEQTISSVVIPTDTPNTLASNCNAYTNACPNQYQCANC